MGTWGACGGGAETELTLMALIRKDATRSSRAVSSSSIPDSGVPYILQHFYPIFNVQSV
jgi:hypothetical protein